MSATKPAGARSHTAASGAVQSRPRTKSRSENGRALKLVSACATVFCAALSRVELLAELGHVFQHWSRLEPLPQCLLPRSEEHTSELQSLAYLVCRLLLEKKKKKLKQLIQKKKNKQNTKHKIKNQQI